MLDLDILDPDVYALPNWAVHVDDETLKDLGRWVSEAVEVDEDSRREWLAQNDQWIKLARQVMEPKSHPWPNAASVKFPLLTTASMQFHARAHQELLKDERVVLAKVLGRDPDGKKAARARRVEDAMSMQFLYRMEDWQDDMDRLLYVLPLVGTCFKKVYWSDMQGRPVSELVLPSELVVSYHAGDWERARKSHILYKTHNDVEEQKRLENYLDVDIGPYGAEPETEEPGMTDEMEGMPRLPEDQPHELIECHCWRDLDEDGYEEPYIVTIDRRTEKVLRIVPRFLRSNVKHRPDGMIMQIRPIEYIVPYKFFPSVDSNTHGMGFGQLLGPLNSAVNSIINQLIDAGNLSNQQAGFLGRGVRVTKGGSVRFRPGEWKELSSTGDDLRKGVFPLPVREPNAVLFQLLGYLVEAGRQVSSVAEVMTGENPGQNQPFSTTQTVLEQGMQVFMGIYKRVYRSLAKEYKLVYNLNYMFLSDAVYAELLDEDTAASVVEDFNSQGLDVLPEADPNLANSIRKQERVRALIEATRAGVQLNQQYIQKQFLEAIDEPEPEVAMQVAPPPPTEAELADKQFYAELEYKYKDLELRAMEKQNVPLKDEAAALANVAKAQAEGKIDPMELQMKRMESDNKLREHLMKMAAMEQKNEADAKSAQIKLGQEAMSSGIKLETEAAKAEIAKQKANESNTDK